MIIFADYFHFHLEMVSTIVNHLLLLLSVYQKLMNCFKKVKFILL